MVLWTSYRGGYEARFDRFEPSFARIRPVPDGWVLIWVYGPKRWKITRAPTAGKLRRMAEAYVRCHAAHIRAQIPKPRDPYQLRLTQAELDDAFGPGQRIRQPSR